MPMSYGDSLTLLHTLKAQRKHHLERITDLQSETVTTGMRDEVKWHCLKRHHIASEVEIVSQLDCLIERYMVS